MEHLNLIIIGLSLLAIGGIATIGFVLVSNNSSRSKISGVKSLMGNSIHTAHNELPSSNKKNSSGLDPLDLDVETFRANSVKKSGAEDLQRKLFRAGYFSQDEKNAFTRYRITCFVICVILIPLILFVIKAQPVLLLLGGVIGLLIGYSLPMSGLEKKIRAREEEIMYYLPLVIEQISIGVSSALDIGPCIAQLVTMADERDSHNPVTEMFVHVEKLIKSGLNLEGALVEVSEAVGMLEVKHTFMFLAQCSKHGGELSKQLQELADSVMSQRQVHIEGKIASLPVKATGPLVTIFAGFFALLFSGLLVRLLQAFGGS
ncbi:MAG: type II secretion system F family protein [Proteobacteria bacterium]|nr:type II secretion system F family protein [Pseudomonadota bacterium]